MNVQFIKELIQPHIIDNQQLSYDSFDSVFHYLEKKQKYEVINLLAELGVELIECTDVVNRTTNDKSNESSISITPKQDRAKSNSTNGYAEPKITWNDKINISNEQLCLLIQEGTNEAKDMIVVKNQKLIHKIVNKYSRSFNHKLDEEDLFQYGALGLLRAAKTFDVSMGNAFSTYATIWIQQQIFRAIADEGYTIRVPVHVFENVIKFSKVERELLNSTKEEIFETAIEKYGFRDEQLDMIIKLRESIITPVYLSTIVSDQGSSELIDFIASDDQPLEDEIIDTMYYEEIICEAKKVLTNREYRVIDSRFGLSNNRPKTLEEIGNILGVTRERVRQIECKALKKIKNRLIFKSIVDEN